MSALAARLAELEPACREDAGYLAYRGALLVEMGNPEAAAALLERALLIAPDHAGAQADYARALALLGDERGAASLVDALLARQDVPEGLRARLQAWEKFLGQDLTTPAWQFGGGLTLRAGRESNLNSAPSRGSLDLTLPDGTVNLPLAASARARGGSATLVEANLQAGRNLESGGRLQLLADVRGRAAPAAAYTDYRQYETLAVLTQPVTNAAGAPPHAANQVSLGASRLDYGGEYLYAAYRIGLARIYQAGACLGGGSLELENRRYPASTNLNGRFAGAGGSLRCPLGAGKISLLGRLGEDQAQKDDRPGGHQKRLDLRLAYARTLPLGHLETEISLGRQADGAAYSEIIENGARRRMTRLGLRLEWSVRLDKRLEGLVSFETSRQDSNIPLFQIDGRALWAGLRWNWGR